MKPLGPLHGSKHDKRDASPEGQAFRRLSDSRDEAAGDRRDNLEDPFKLYRCHTIMNCAQVRPKGLNQAKAIASINVVMVDRVT